jgi:hypothetical protein
MKKSFVTLMMVVMAASAFAVDLPKQGFGVQVGWAQPILRLNSPDSKEALANTVKLNGFKVGLVYDASYIAGFGSTIGLNYTFGMSNSKWSSVSAINDYPKTRMLITYHQLELYVDWQYKFEVAKETYLILYTGPSLQCGLDFTMRIDKQVEDPPMSGDIRIEYGQRFSAYNIGNDDMDPTHNTSDNALKRLNVTWGVGAGFQYKRYYLRGGYDFGLINPYKNADFSTGNHTRGRLDQWNIKLGVYFWYKD